MIEKIHKSQTQLETQSLNQKEPSLWEYIVKPDKITATLAKEADLKPEEEKILVELFDSLRYRLTIANFLAQAKDMEPKERVGVVFFVGLINLADDLIDSDLGLSQTKNIEQMRESLLNHTVSLGKDTSISLRNLLEQTLSKFSLAKQQLITDFLNEALITQVQLEDSAPGSYTFEQALTYRQNTSNRYSEVGAKLINISEAKKLEQTIIFGNLFQMIDDVADLYDDFSEAVMNPVIGLASDTGEVQTLENITEKDIPSNFILKIRFARNLFRKMPEVRKKYKAVFSSELNKLPAGKSRTVAKLLGRVML